MNLAEFVSRQRDRLIGEIIAGKQKMGFRIWVKALRKSIPVAELGSDALWKVYTEQTAQVWGSLQTGYAACDVQTLQVIAKNTQDKLKQYGQVVDSPPEPSRRATLALER